MVRNPFRGKFPVSSFLGEFPSVCYVIVLFEFRRFCIKQRCYRSVVLGDFIHLAATVPSSNCSLSPRFQFEKSSRLSREAEDQLKVIPKFCFPDSQDWKPSAHMPR